MRILLGLLLVHGWYSKACCGDRDCHPVPCESIAEVKDGYVYDGVHFDRAQPSPDNQCHACIQTYGNVRSGTCLFIQVTT